MVRVPFDIRVQHDNNLNAPHLLSPEDAVKVNDGTMRRVDGNCVCEICGKVWHDHPPVIGALWLTKACDGEHLKL